MYRLLPIIASMASSDLQAVVHRKKRNAVLYALAGLLAFTAWLLAAAAMVVYLAPTYGLLSAVTGLCAVLAATALVIVAVVAVLNRADAKKAEKNQRPALLGAAALALAPTLLRGPALLKVGAAIAAFAALSKATSMAADDE